jgi:pyrimidine deaminase RibD-like protein
MKKVQFVFAVVAFLVAGIGVIAKELKPTVQYFEEPNATSLTCTTLLTVEPCEVGNTTPCTVLDSDQVTKWVTYLSNPSDCVHLKKD